MFLSLAASINSKHNLKVIFRFQCFWGNQQMTSVFSCLDPMQWELAELIYLHVLLLLLYQELLHILLDIKHIVDLFLFCWIFFTMVLRRKYTKKKKKFFFSIILILVLASNPDSINHFLHNELLTSVLYFVFVDWADLRKEDCTMREVRRSTSLKLFLIL